MVAVMPDPNHDSDDYALIRPGEAARILGVDPSTLWRWVADGKLAPRRTVGGHRRYRRADVIALSDELAAS